jgi:hypothetical protein
MPRRRHKPARRLPERGVLEVHTHGGEQEMIGISESGLYRFKGPIGQYGFVEGQDYLVNKIVNQVRSRRSSRSALPDCSGKLV